MANVAVSFGAVLIVLGIAGYFGSSMVSLTALIPAAFGLVLLVVGVIARDPEKRKHAMHVAAMVGVLGFLGSARGLGNLIPLLCRARGGASRRCDRAIDHGHPDVDLHLAMCTFLHKCAAQSHDIELSRYAIRSLLACGHALRAGHHEFSCPRKDYS